MGGQSVSIETGLRIIREGTLIADYAGTRRYDHNGCSYFIPEVVWKKHEFEARSASVAFIEGSGNMRVTDDKSVTIMQCGTVYISVTDEPLAKSHGWVRVPEAQTDAEHKAGLIRVSRK